jgi:hypothetical protein
MSLLAPVPQFPNVLYAGISYRLARSADGGYTWIESQTALPEVGCALVSAIVLDPQDSNTVYVGTQDSYCESALDCGRASMRA